MNTAACQTYKVVQTIQSREIDNNAPVEVSFYTGRSLAQAMSAMGSAAADCQDEDKYYTVLSVAMYVVTEPASVVHKFSHVVHLETGIFKGSSIPTCECGKIMCPLMVTDYKE